MICSIMAILATAEDPTNFSIVVAFTIFLQTVGFLAFTALFNFLDLDPQAKSFYLLRVFLFHRSAFFILKSMSISSESLDYSLFVLRVFSFIAAIIAFAKRIAKKFILKAFTV